MSEKYKAKYKHTHTSEIIMAKFMPRDYSLA